MKSPKRFYFPVLAGSFLLLLWGCQGQRPTAPTRSVAMDVELPLSNELKAALAGSNKNELLYVVRNANGIIAKGKFDATTASSADGSFRISLNVIGENSVLSLQLNDANTHEPLAIGAAPLSFTQTVIKGGIGNQAGTVSASKVPPPAYKGKPSLTLDMGAVNTNCSTFYHSGVFQGYSLNFLDAQINYYYQDDAFVEGLYDSSQNYLGPELVDAGCVSIVQCQNTIAYMGNGDLVDNAYVPPDAQFYSSSSQSKMAVLSTSQANAVLKVGDIYCLKLTSDPGGHAWIQVSSIYTGDGTSVSFRYRVNSLYPFYGLETTPCYNW